MSATISVVIPVYNEEAGLAALYERLYPELDKLGRQYEVVFVDDGSSDRSVALLREQFQRRPTLRVSLCWRGTRANTWRSSRGLRSRVVTTSSHSMQTCRTLRKR